FENRRIVTRLACRLVLLPIATACVLCRGRHHSRTGYRRMRLRDGTALRSPEDCDCWPCRRRGIPGAGRRRGRYRRRCEFPRRESRARRANIPTETEFREGLGGRRTAVYCRRSILPVRVCKRTVFCRSPRSARHRIRSAGRVDLDVWSVVRVVGRRTPGQPVPSRKWPGTTGLPGKQV